MTRLRKLLAGAGFRFALLFTFAIMGCMAVIGALTRYAVVTELQRQAQGHAEAEATALVDEFVHGGRPDLDAALAGRLRAGEPLYRYSVVGDADKAKVVAAIGPAESNLSVVRSLGDGNAIVVSDDLARVRAVRETIDRAFISALGLSAVLGLGTGLLLSGSLLRRLDCVTRAAEAVAEGDLGSRIPLAGTGDEFDRLAVTLNRMLDRIVALMANLRQVSTDVAHDLRTPMSRLRQDLEAAQRQEETVDAYRRTVTRALVDIDGILDVFAALLRIAQVESGSRRAGFRMVDLSAVATEVAGAYGAAAEDDGRELLAHVAPDVLVEGDRDLLAQLLANLVENALRHSPATGRINIGVSSAPDETARLWVADEGPGIPPEERLKVLRRFYRLDGSRSGEGHGLGLSLVAAVAELHRANLVLSDLAPGLKVELHLPRKILAAAGEATSASLS